MRRALRTLAPHVMLIALGPLMANAAWAGNDDGVDGAADYSYQGDTRTRGVGRQSIDLSRLGWPDELDSDAEDRQRTVRTPPELFALESLTPETLTTGDPKTDLRLDAMRQTAGAIGVQAGVKWRYDIINTLMLSHSMLLDQLFNFRPLLIGEGRIVPPVVLKTEGTYELLTSTSAAQTLASFRIFQDARLATEPPNWRDYLLRSFPGHKTPHEAMLPTNDIERKVWEQAVRQGFWVGADQADRLFHTYVARLRRDYLGMIQFKLLALQGVVSVPMLAEGDLGIQVNGKELLVGQRIFQINDPAGFIDPRRWRPKVHYVPATSSRATKVPAFEVHEP